MKIVGSEFLDDPTIFRNGGEITVVIPSRERVRFGKDVSAFSLPEYSVIFQTFMGPEEEEWKRGWISFVGELSKDPVSNCFLVNASTVHWSKSPPPSFWTFAKCGPCVTGVFVVVQCSEKVSATEHGSTNDQRVMCCLSNMDMGYFRDELVPGTEFYCSGRWTNGPVEVIRMTAEVVAPNNV
ncbi:hypothetical protein MJO29_005328 [Puccinia striiformis f. sp. tritici]|nr:hypothetical protein MJO29_005328 [Puccinia striiformis f. sp. tritici]